MVCREVCKECEGMKCILLLGSEGTGLECNGDCSEDRHYAARGEYFSQKRGADRRRNEVEDNRLVEFYDFMDIPHFSTGLEKPGLPFGTLL